MNKAKYLEIVSILQETDAKIKKIVGKKNDHVFLNVAIAELSVEDKVFKELESETCHHPDGSKYLELKNPSEYVQLLSKCF